MFFRLLAFSLIIGFGFILMVSLAIHALVDLLHEELRRILDEATLIFLQGLNYLILFLVITTLFAIIFKILPDGKLRWNDAFLRATLTAVLLLIGKSLIGL